MKAFTRALAVVLCWALIAQAQGNSFNRVRYNGGTVSSSVSPHDWNNRLTVTAEAITLKLKDGATVEIDPKTVTSLSYGQEAHRRVGTMIALAVLVAPVALFGLFHKTRLHFIGIQYSTQENQKAGVLLQGDKDNYRAILVALQSVTGVPVSVGEKDREFIPVGVTTSVSREPETANAAPQKSTDVHTATAEMGTVVVTSTPDGADVFADDAFVGNTTESLKLSPGKHTVRVSKAGYQDWSREITVQSGSDLKLTATLER